MSCLPSPPAALKGLIIDNFDSFTHNLVELVHNLTLTEPIVVYNTVAIDSIIALLPFIDFIILGPGPGKLKVRLKIILYYCTTILTSSFGFDYYPIGNPSHID